LQIEPESHEAKRMQATLLLATNRVDELADIMKRDLAAAGPQAGELLREQWLAFTTYPDKPVVKQLFDQLTAAYPDLAEAHLVRAQAALSVKDMNTARGEVDKALALRADLEPAVILKAGLTTDPVAQRDYLKSFLDAHPNARDARLGYARALVMNKQYDEARSEFRKLLKDFPDNPDILFAVGILSLQLNDVAEGERQLKHYAEIGGNEIDAARYYLGQIAEQAGRRDEALNWYRAVAAGEQLLPARTRAAQLLIRDGKFDEAREQIAAARAASPGDNRLLIAEAQLLRDAGHYAESYALLKDALQSQPDDPELLYETALAADKLDDFATAERHLRRLIELKPDSPQGYNALGYALVEHNQRLDEATRLIDKALALAPDDPFILDSKGWLLFRQGKADEALTYLQKSFAQMPDAEVAAHIGEVLWTQGRHDEALKIWREAQKTNPNNDALNATIKRFAP
jgi:tetratricopeptide (TPR) repeat protein